MGKYVEKTGSVATPSELGTGTPDGTTFLRGDSTWAAAGGGGPHATSHVTGGTDVIANAVASGNAGLMSGADKAKLDGVASGAEVNVNADWNAGSGDAQILNKPAFSDATISTSDITTNNATTAKHGFLSKLPGGTATFLRADGAFASPTASASISQTEIDFGATPVAEASFTITDAAVSAASRIIGTVAYVAPTGKDLDELEMDGLDLKFAPGSGQFTLYARGLDGYVADKFVVNYQVGA